MLIRIFTAITLMFLTVGCGDFSNTSQTNNSPSKKPKGKPSYLFVIMSNQGSISKNRQGEFILTLNHGDIEKVLAFSDRPFRIVKHMTGEELKQMWSQGNNSFAKDNPNAAVIINQHLQTVILTSVNITQNTMTFTLKSDGPQSLVPMNGPTQLFIDHWIDEGLR